MKMTSSQVVSLQTLFVLCLSALVAAQTSTPRPPTSVTTGVQQTAGSTMAPSRSASGGAGMSSTDLNTQPEAEPTSKPMMTTDDDENDTDNDNGAGDQDMNSKDMEDNDRDGLRGDQIALAILATLLSVATIAFFVGLIYWKMHGTTYVTVSANTTYLK